MLAVAAALLGGCASTPRDSSITQDDLDVTVSAMAASLAASDFLASRTADAPRIVMVTNKVSNQTDNIMSTAERWMLIARVQQTLPIRAMADQKNIVFVLPPERVQMLKQQGFADELPAGLTPTHVMTATFISNPRGAKTGGSSVANVRENFYYLEYAVTAIDSREILWSDAFAFKRIGHGRIID